MADLNTINITQGYAFKMQVQRDSAKLIFIKSGLKYTIDTIILEDGKYYLTATGNETKTFEKGLYRYQLQDDENIIGEGSLNVILNFDLADDSTEVLSENQILLNAIEAQIAGKATVAQQSMSVGDKSISYYSITDLLKLRDYFKAKVDEENGKLNKNDGFSIKYQWSLR